MSVISDLEKDWAGRISSSNPRQDRYTHVVSAADFFAQLTLLAELSYDPRFRQARQLLGDAVIEHGLTDGSGRWRKSPRPSDELPPPDYAWAVDRLMNQGIAQREAFARVAVRYQVPAASWGAALKTVERAWRNSGHDGHPQ